MARRDSGASSDDGPLTARITNEAFLCPIGCSTMRDPVFLADGHSYERANIDAWIETILHLSIAYPLNQEGPLTRCLDLIDINLEKTCLRVRLCTRRIL